MDVFGSLVGQATPSASTATGSGAAAMEAMDSGTPDAADIAAAEAGVPSVDHSKSADPGDTGLTSLQASSPAQDLTFPTSRQVMVMGDARDGLKNANELLKRYAFTEPHIIREMDYLDPAKQILELRRHNAHAKIAAEKGQIDLDTGNLAASGDGNGYLSPTQRLAREAEIWGNAQATSRKVQEMTVFGSDPSLLLKKAMQGLQNTLQKLARY